VFAGVARADDTPPPATNNPAPAADTPAPAPTPGIGNVGGDTNPGAATPVTPAPTPQPAPASATPVPSTAATPTTATTAAATTSTATPVSTTTGITTTTPAPATTFALAQLAAPPAPDPGCLVVGAFAVHLPDGRERVVGPALAVQGSMSRSVGGSVVSASRATLDASCPAHRVASGLVAMSSLSLFGGFVTATSVRLTLAADGAYTTVSGLSLGGQPISASSGGRFPLADWGSLTVTPPQVPPAADGSQYANAFAIELSKPYAGLPAGTTVLAAVGERPATPPPAPAQPAAAAGGPPALVPGAIKPARLAERPPVATASGPAEHRSTHPPLTVTPPLEAGPYVFPVVGASSFGDGYGAPRSDVSGGWHHGDDIFAPLGTPVVAVADGRLNRIGWEPIGGWRLWLRDGAGDEFYYAHLSGYSLYGLEHRIVRAGQVIGFIGNTGDAFTTLPHLHFEIHPRSLLHLAYDGAVDPTSYLESWHRLARASAAEPGHPPLPIQAAARKEALQNFRELLAARGLDHARTRHAPSPLTLTVAAPQPPRLLAADPGRGPLASSRWPAFATALGLLALVLVLLGFAAGRERDR
jgi:murein DD-endopeptidase MepM/ murein hydrolase activator NlpD